MDHEIPKMLNLLKLLLNLEQKSIKIVIFIVFLSMNSGIGSFFISEILNFLYYLLHIIRCDEKRLQNKNMIKNPVSSVKKETT